MAADPARSAVLPIEHALPELRAALASHTAVVLQAPPGAGKTTRVPLALLDEPWLAARRILVLEPRRLATRAAARRMAAMLGEQVGATVGFRVRGETRVSAGTRVEVVTEGVLTRMLLDDPTLEHIGAVLFDEFHERSLQADVGLALTLQTQELLRPDLRVVVMSATLDGAAVARLLGDAPIVTSEGRRFPVEIRHRARRADMRVDDAAALAVRVALASDEGSILVFLPGTAEIRRCMAQLERASLPSDVHVLPLYGDLSPAAQDEAIATPAAGMRKVVLATSIAETSLTIDGVRVVVDAGVSRVSRFSPRTGMARLETVRVSRSSADQRAGRAGRTAPGICYRLWASEEDVLLPEHSRAEILEADLAPLALDLASAGVSEPSSLRWLDVPPVAAMSQASELLRQLGALDAENRITAHGREMSRFGVHPRLAHMMLVSRTRDAGATACVVASLLQERDVFRRDSTQRDVDFRSRVAAVAEGRGEGANVDRDALRRVRDQARSWQQHLRVSRDERVDEHLAGACLSLAYPERVAQRRRGDEHRYLLRSGAGAVLDDPGVLAGSEFLAIADLDGRSPQSRIYVAAPIDAADVESQFAHEIEREDVVEWDATAGVVTAVRRERLGAIVLRERVARDADEEVVADVLLRAIQHEDGIALVWSEAARRLRERIAFVRTLDTEWPDVSDAALSLDMERWLRPHLSGLRRRADVEKLNLHDVFLDMLTWEQRRELDVLAPTHVTVPTGSQVRVDYNDASSPVLAVRLQEMFGLADTPRIARGRVPLTLHLLSPARRPMQVTRDLAGFWRSSYFEVRKEMRGRYPKHYWPDDPLRAEPTSRAKPR